MSRTAVGVLCLMLASCVTTRVWHANTGHFSELVDSIPITQCETIDGDTVCEYEFTVVFSQEMTGLREGDVLVVLAEWEATHEHAYNVMMASYVTLADTSTATTRSAAREITESNGFNITADMHHGVRSQVGTFRVPAALTGTRYVNVVVYAASTAASPGHRLIIEQDYGRLSVIRIARRAVLAQTGNQPKHPKPGTAH